MTGAVTEATNASSNSVTLGHTTTMPAYPNGNVQIYFQVVATDNFSRSATSAVFAVSPPNPILPGNLTTGTVGNTYATINWTYSSSMVESALVTYGVGNTNTKWLGAVVAGSAQLTGLTASTAYQATVQLYGPGGITAAPTPVTFTTT
jgi:hypothetical protein